MQAKLFLDLLEKQDLLDPEILSALRKQLAESPSRITPESIVKLLVDNGHLSRFQATKLIANFKERMGTMEPEQPPPPPPKKYEDDLGFADDVPSKSESKNGGKSKSSSMASAAVIVGEDDLDGETVDVEVVDAEVEEFVEVEDLTQVEVVDDVAPANDRAPRFRTDHDGLDEPIAGLPKAPVTVVTSKKKAKSKWDSYKFLAPLFVLLFLLIPFVFLVYWKLSGSAEEALDHAKKLYEQRDYDQAQKWYERFVEGYPTDSRVSFAKVRVGLSKMRSSIERQSDPRRAFEIVKDVLPTIANEKGLSSQRTDVAGALLALAEKFINKADSEKVVAEKNDYMDRLDEHLENFRNATFMGNQERAQFEQRLTKISEDQQRIRQDIRRIEDLNATSAQISAALDNNEVLTAFQLRRELLRRHPQLEVAPTVLELVNRATGLLRELVTGATVRPVLRDSDSENLDQQSVLLTNLRGQVELGIEDVAFLRIQNSIYAIKVGDGSVLWRRFVGPGLSDPLRVSRDPTSDLILAVPHEGKVLRVRAADGSLVWQLKWETEIVQPTIDRDDVLVALKDGHLFSIEAASGEIRWAKKLPQAIDVGPCFGPGQGACYVLAEDSSIYALSRMDGRCIEVFYLGHAKSAVRVPPVFTLGHLFVFDNGAGYCYARILRSDEKGQGLTMAESPMRFQGNIDVPIAAEGRRVTIMTDRGEIAILDIEPSSANKQVSKIAAIVASDTQPQTNWILVDRNELWVASSRLIRYEIQVSRQDLVREWIREEGDTFLFRPQRYGNRILVGRYVRGSDGVRVSLLDGKSAEPTWETDLALPTSILKPGPSGSLFAMTTQGALYVVDRAVRDAGQKKPVENPGRNQRLLRFHSPVEMADGKWAALNFSQSNQLAVFDPKAPSGSMLKVLVLGSNQLDPSCEPIALGTNVLICSNNGQIVLINAATGQPAAEPFQPVVAPGERYRWNRPTVLSDQQTVIAVDNNQRLFRISTRGQLRALNEVSLPSRCKGPLASIGDSVVAVLAGAPSDSVNIYNGLDLSLVAELPLEGSHLSGPFVVDGKIYVLTDIGGLVAVDPSGKKLWSSKIAPMRLIGPPLAFGADLLLAGSAGQIVRVSASTGELVGASKVGRGLSAIPIVDGNQLILASDDGAIFQREIPSTVEEDDR